VGLLAVSPPLPLPGELFLLLNQIRDFLDVEPPQGSLSLLCTLRRVWMRILMTVVSESRTYNTLLVNLTQGCKVRLQLSNTHALVSKTPGSKQEAETLSGLII